MNEAVLVSRLLRWARWKMASGVALGYPGQVSFLRLAPPTATYFRDPRIDEECMETDKAYQSLPELHMSVLRVEYLSCVNKDRTKAQLFGRSRRGYFKCLQEAYHKMEFILSDLQ